METGDTVTRRYRRCLRECADRGHGVGASRFPQAPAPPPDYDERSHLHDSFTQMIQSLQELATAQGEWGGDGSSGRRGLRARKMACVQGGPGSVTVTLEVVAAGSQHPVRELLAGGTDRDRAEIT